ncbi:MAG: hypothetical protein AB7S80_07020 [Rhizobiaceae bacterium]
MVAPIALSEQRGIPTDGVAGWVDGIASSMGQESEQEVHLYDGPWLQIRTRPTADGRAMVVVPTSRASR